MANDRDEKTTKGRGRRVIDDDSDDLAAGPSVTETIKKLVTAGVSAAFMTEESIRSFVSELKLPKETLNLLLQSAAKSKEELMNRVSREVIGIISKIDFVREASRFAEEHRFRITAEIEVIRKDGKDASGGTVAHVDTGETSVELKLKPNKQKS